MAIHTGCNFVNKYLELIKSYHIENWGPPAYMTESRTSKVPC